MTTAGRPGSALTSSKGGAGHPPANLGDILERVLDKGLVIAGDIQVNLLDIELLTIKLRLVVASLETAKEVGINWWESDPWLTGRGDRHRELARENRELRDRLAALEAGDDDATTRAIESRPVTAESQAAEPEAAGGDRDG